MTRWRRLVRDYEARIDVSEAMILLAMGGNLLRKQPIHDFQTDSEGMIPKNAKRRLHARFSALSMY
jgi:hypothetical protein